MTANEGPIREHAGLAAAGTEISLQHLVLESPGIKAFLVELAMMAASRLSRPGNSIHSGVTVLRHRKPQAVAASDPAASALDELQNGFGQGPCLTALQQRTTLLVPDLTEETHWTPYPSRARTESGPTSTSKSVSPLTRDEKHSQQMCDLVESVHCAPALWIGRAGIIRP